MKFSCEKLLLQNAVNTTSRAVAAKSSIPALEGLLLQCGDGVLTVSGYNMQTGIRTRFPVEEQEGGELVLSARLFGDIIRRMPDDMITFSSDEKLMVHLSCGDADFDILALSAADFPELPEVEEKYSVSLPEKTLRSMIQQTSFAVSTNEARPVHMGELFEIGDNGLTVVAVDEICEDIDAFATIPLGQRHILFEMGETELICRRLEGEFLDYKNAIPRRNPISVTVDTKAMLESLDRVSVVISEKLKSPVRCIFEQDRVLLSAKTANGDAKDVCRILVPTDGEESFLYMVLPVRLKAQ